MQQPCSPDASCISCHTSPLTTVFSPYASLITHNDHPIVPTNPHPRPTTTTLPKPFILVPTAPLTLLTSPVLHPLISPVNVPNPTLPLPTLIVVVSPTFSQTCVYTTSTHVVTPESRIVSTHCVVMEGACDVIAGEEKARVGLAVISRRLDMESF